ncbi:MAG: hypothetical protein SFY68_08210 [Candidatus Sumerlaeia bacterium]|nr:hypothetical protein [Candidatus Sumerlaeia bacterium]
MSPITSKTGEPIDLDDPALEFEETRLELIAQWNVAFEPMGEEDEAVDPAVFIPELQTYVSQVINVRKKAIKLEFREKGIFFGAAYWVFSYVDERQGPFYALLCRDYPITEFALLEQDYLSPTLGKITWTPAQAALLDFFEPKEELPLE